MASSGQSPFGLYVTLASVALSLVAVTTVTTKQDGTLMNAAAKRQRRKKIPQARPQPTRRSAIDGTESEVIRNDSTSNADVPNVEGRASLEIESTVPQTTEDDQQEAETAAAISRTAKLSRSLRIRRGNGEDVTELQNELSLVAANLCRLQQGLIVDPESISAQNDFATSFKSSMQSITTTFSALEQALVSNAPSSQTLNDVRRRLKDERPALELLSGSPVPVHLPPTPPSDAVPEGPSNPPISTEITPQPSPRISFDTGVTPSAARVEPPASEYLSSQTSPIPMAPLSGSSEHATESASVDSTPSIQAEDADSKSLASGISSEAIYSAVTENNSTTLTQLLESGSLDPTAQFGELQRTALHQAAHLNHVDCLRTLLSHGAVMGAEDAKGDTALHLAAWVGNTEAITALLEHGADVDWLSGRDGYSPLWCAVSAHQEAAAKLLLRHGAQVDLRPTPPAVGRRTSSSNDNLTPLHQAAITGQGAICSLLLAHGAGVDVRDSDASTPLHYAAVSGSAAAVSALVREGAALDARQLHGLTPAHWAAYKGHGEALARLLDYGARVDPRAAEGATPLHLAASRGHVAAAALLLARGARTNGAKARWAGVAGTPADMAEAKGFVDLAEMLR